MHRLISRLVILVLVSVADAASAQWTWTPETGRFVNMDNLPKETPELQVEYTRTLMVGGDYSRAFEETDKFNEFYADSDFADENQYLRGEIKLADEKYVVAAREFQSVISKFPESGLYDQVIRKQYEIGDELYARGEQRMSTRTARAMQESRYLRRLNFRANRPFKKAIDVYTMVIENQPFTPEAAEAQYKIGKCNFARQEYLDAGFEYRRVIEDYPDSEWVREASFDLTRCYEEAALDPDYDQAPAQLAMDSIAEFKRRFPEDSRVADREVVSVKMNENIAEQRFRTARHYEKRDDLDAARIYYEITAYEFPGTEASTKALEWIEQNPRQNDLQSEFIGRAVAEAQ
jgi:outer membrane protein assembly factor BamD (BamD/ComL family)